MMNSCVNVAVVCPLLVKGKTDQRNAMAMVACDMATHLD